MRVRSASHYATGATPSLEELFTGKLVPNPIEKERAWFAALQQDIQHMHDNLNKDQDELDLLALAGVIETEASHNANFNAALVMLGAHHRLAPPLLTPSVVQGVWKMYQEETASHLGRR